MRELRNAVQRAYVMAQDSVITERWMDLGGGAATKSTAVPQLVFPIGTSLADAQRKLILATLAHFEGHKERTAAALGVSLKTLYNRLKEYSEDVRSSEW